MACVGVCRCGEERSETGHEGKDRERIECKVWVWGGEGRGREEEEKG